MRKEGNIREIISQTTLRELIQGDKKIFAERGIDLKSLLVGVLGTKVLSQPTVQNVNAAGPAVEPQETE